MEFADLHHHTENSLLDGYGTVREHVKRCKELGHTAVAMTEHGTLRGILALDHAAGTEGVRPIFGCEFYVTVDHTRRSLTPEQEESVTAGLKGKEATAAKKKLERALGIHERRHLVVLAENDHGLRNLISLSNIANRKGFYYKPRIDLGLLEEFSEGLVVNSGCVGSVIAQSALNGDFDRAVDDTLWFAETFGDRFSLELQPHPVPEQEKWNRIALRLSEEFDIPLVASNDSHYPAPDDWRTHDTLVAIGHRVEIDDCDRMRYEIETFGLKSAEDMVEAFQRVHPYIPRETVEAAVERAAEQADRCRAKPWKPKKILLPAVTDADPDEELKGLTLDGWGWRQIEDRAERNGLDPRDYLKRLNHELGVIRGLEFSPYFLIVHDMLDFARREGIMVGPGRGSAAGSLTCYLLGITSIDPLEHGLLFERFLTPGRKDWPDIDIDFEITRRYEVFEYLREKYGEEHVAQITTLTRLKGKSALRDVARAHGVHYTEVDKIASSIVETTTRDDDNTSIEAALEKDQALREFQSRYPEVIEEAMQLEGHIRQVGVHPAGIVASPIPLTDFVPMERRLVNTHGSSDKVEVMVTALDKYAVPELGLVKLDVLGLKTLSILADCSRMVEERTGEAIDYEAITFDDDEIFRMFTEGDLVGVFQFDTPAARASCAGVVFESFEDVSALNALNRPGTAKSGLADEWRQRKSGKSVKQHPAIAKVCEDTLGVIVYQEHVLKILQDLAGYSPEEAGRLRKAISKSAGVGYLEEERPVFVEGMYKTCGMEPEDAEALWTQIEQFGAYGFNKSHSAAYGAIAYWCQWAKLVHPAEFFCALLTYTDDPAEASRIAREASRRGVPVDPPSVNLSRGSWTVSPDGGLVSGLDTIRGVSENSSSEIQAGQPYSNFCEFLTAVDRRKVHRGVIVALAKAGAMRDLIPNTKWFVENAKALLKKVSRKNWRDLIEGELEASKSEPDYTEEDWRAVALTVGISGTEPLAVINGLRDSLLRPEKDWDPIHECYDGSLIMGIMTAKRVGKSGRKRWASIELEGPEGARIRLRMNDEAYQQFRPVLDAGTGTICAARIKVWKGTARPNLLVDLLSLRKKWREGAELDDYTWQERAVMKAKEHPAGSGAGKWWKGSDCLVLRVTERRDKNGRYMAFLSVDGGVAGGRAREVVVFADTWDYCDDVQPGDVIHLRAKTGERKGSLIAKSIEN